MMLADRLRRGLHGLQLSLPAEAPAKLLAYLELLARWNRVYNLTAVRKPEQMLTRHVLDSLAVLPYVQPDRLLDVGSGAGLPGIPLAVARPDWTVVLLDSQLKKTRFLTQAVAELGLANATVVHSRIEDYRAAPFTTVVSRAFGTVADLVARTARLCSPQGVILAMKGVYPVAELAVLPPGFHVEAVHRLAVPELAAERHLVVVRADRAAGE